MPAVSVIVPNYNHARRKVTERHDVSIAAPRILEIIERTIAAK